MIKTHIFFLHHFRPDINLINFPKIPAGSIRDGCIRLGWVGIYITITAQKYPIFFCVIDLNRGDSILI